MHSCFVADVCTDASLVRTLVDGRCKPAPADLLMAAGVIPKDTRSRVHLRCMHVGMFAWQLVAMSGSPLELEAVHHGV